MNKLLTLLLGVCLTQATLRSEDLADKVFGQGREYVYKYEGEVKSGIPQSSNRFSGMKIECEARLQFKTATEVLMRLEKIQLKTLRGELESPEEKTLKKLMKKTSQETTFEKKHQDAFRQDHFSSSPEEWERSIKTSSSSSQERETPSFEKWEQQETIRKEKEQKTSSEEAGRPSSAQSGSSSQRSSQSASREESEEVPEQELAELRRQLEKAVRVTYEQGQVVSIQADRGEPQWSVNIKRGICNMLQITRNPKNSELLDKDGRAESNVAFEKAPERLFRIMEQGVNGLCETQYDIRDSQTQPGAQLVTRTKNLQNCRQKPKEWLARITGGKAIKDPTEEHFQSHAQTRMRVVTDRSPAGKFLIQRAESRDQHVFVPYSQQGGEVITFAKQILELVEAKTTISGPKIPEPSQAENKGNLVFVFEPRRPEGGSSAESREESRETEEKVKQLCEGIARGLREAITEETPKKFLQLVKELRKMSQAQLKQFCIEKIPKIKQSSRETSQEKEEVEARKLIIDAVSMVGTEEALKAVGELLQEDKIAAGDAQSLIGGLSVSIATCTPSGTNIMLEIAKSKLAQQNQNLRKVAWLAFGTMVHKLIQTHPQQTPEIIQLKKEYANQLLHGVQQDKAPEEQMMCIKAIGNAGLEDSVDRLVQIINSKTTPTEIRLQAIYALRRIAKKLPHKTRNILFPVFKNPENPVEERAAAFVVMMDSEPQTSFLELLAQSTQRETSNQVGRFVYTALKSCAASRLTRDQRMRRTCEKALRLCRPFNLGMQYSETSEWQAMSEEMRMGASVKIQTIADKRSVLPRAATAKMNVQALGLSINFLEAGVRASGLQTMVDSLYRQYSDNKSFMYHLKKKSQETSREYRDSASTERQRTLRNIEAEKIQSKLNIKTRAPEDPKGQIYLKVGGNELYYHQFRSALLEKFVREDSLSIGDIEKQLQEGVKTSWTKASLLADITQRTPTSLGLPLKLDLKAVAVTRSDIGGKVTVAPRLFREDRPKEQQAISDVNAEVTSTHSTAMQITAKMMVDCRVIKSGVALEVSVKGLIPMSGKANFDLKNRVHKLTVETPEKERELLVVKSRPIVFTEQKTAPKTGRQVRDVLKKEITIQGEKIQRFPSQMKVAYGKQALGLEFALKSSMVSRLNKETSAPYQPFTGPAELRLAVRPGENRPEKVEIECVLSSEARSSEEKPSGAQPPRAMRAEVTISAKHPRQDRTVGIKMLIKDEQVEIDPRRRELDSRERKYPRKLLVRSLREKEPAVSAETQQELRQEGRQQTRRTIAIQIDRSRIPQLESWDFKSCLDMQMEFPTNRDARLIQDGIVKAILDAKWGADCSGRGPRVQLEAKFQKSVQQRREERHQEATEWDSREGITQSQELYLDSLTKSLTSLFPWPSSDNEEWRVRSREQATSMEQATSSEQQSGQSSSRGSSQESIESSEQIQFKRQRRNLYKQCLKDRREGQQYSRACQEAVRQRSQLRELDVEINYQNLPAWLQEACLAAQRYIENTFYGRSSTQEIGNKNAPNQIRLRATLDAAEREMNVSIRKPEMTQNLTRVPLAWVPLWFPSTRQSIAEQAMDTATKYMYTPFCKVQANDKIRTFDDVEYKYKVGKCDHILAKDASPEEKFMVLVNKPEAQRPEKTVKVFLKSTKIEMRVPRGASSQEQSKESISQETISQEQQKSKEETQGWRQSQEGQQSRKSQEKGISQQTSSEGSASKSKSFEWSSSEENLHRHTPIEVTIDGRQVQVQPGEAKKIRHQVTGKVMCTLYCHGNGIELKSPQHGLHVKVDGHNVEVKVSHDYRKKLVGLCGNFDGEQSNEYEGPREEIYKTPKEFALSYLIPSSQCEGEGKKQPVMRNIMITRLNQKNEEQACFSKTPVAQCPEGSRKTKSEVRSTEFHCLPKELQSTQKMIKMHKTKPLGDKLQGKSTDLVQDVEAELECRE
ncbi:vitellogenin-6-like [Branchiostoma floridae x Branchiostoma japonicum]